MTILKMNRIAQVSKRLVPTYILGYSVSVFDVAKEGVFGENCGVHVQYEIYFADETGADQHVIQIGFSENIITAPFFNRDDLLRTAGLAK